MGGVQGIVSGPSSVGNQGWGGEQLDMERNMCHFTAFDMNFEVLSVLSDNLCLTLWPESDFIGDFYSSSLGMSGFWEGL